MDVPNGSDSCQLSYPLEIGIISSRRLSEHWMRRSAEPCWSFTDETGTVDSNLVAVTAASMGAGSPNRCLWSSLLHMRRPSLRIRHGHSTLMVASRLNENTQSSGSWKNTSVILRPTIQDRSTSVYFMGCPWMICFIVFSFTTLSRRDFSTRWIRWRGLWMGRRAKGSCFLERRVRRRRLEDRRR